MTDYGGIWFPSTGGGAVTGFGFVAFSHENIFASVPKWKNGE